MKYPKEFLAMMEKINIDTNLLCEALAQTPTSALFFNEQSNANILDILKKDYEAIPYAKGGFYTNIKWGNHPWYLAGGIYIQEPSAQLPVNAIKIKADAKVLDLCSSPGGKLTQVANFAKEGWVLANEINKPRAITLLGNIERLGLKNVSLVSLEASELSKEYQNYFDLVIVDAPCSGEGMFRKNPEAVALWSVDAVRQCQERQIALLLEAKKMVADSGILLYSTCTLNPEENEGVVSILLKDIDIELLPLDKNVTPYLTNNRFLPYNYPGEGQSVFAFRVTNNLKRRDGSMNLTKLALSEAKIIDDFLTTALTHIPFTVAKYNNNIVAVNKQCKLPSRNIINAGVKIGEIQKGRLIPHHQFFSAYGTLFKNQLNLSAESKEVANYLQGLEISVEMPDGWGAIIVDGAPLGGFKASNNTLKNHYPKGLRK